MKRRVAVILAVAGTAWLLVLAGQRTLQTSAPEEPARAVVVSAEEVSRIVPGMSYADCVRVIGAEGVPFGSSASPEVDPGRPEWISYVWRNDEDSYVMVSFHHGEVERTRAFNLK